MTNYVFAFLIYLAVTTASWYTAQAILQYSTGSAIVIDTEYRRGIASAAFCVAALMTPIGFPWGPAADSLCWLGLILGLELTAAQGVRIFLLLLLGGIVKRLTLLGAGTLLL